jgi:hypothetical protein
MTNSERPAMTRRIPATIALLSALALAPALAGCSVVESVVEGATGGDVQIGGPSIPDGFPAEVPVYDGDILNGSSITKNGETVYNVVVKVDDTSVFDTIRTELTDAGFTPAEGYDMVENSGTITGLFGNGTWSVLVAVTTQDVVGTVANYTVTSAVAG